MQDLMEIFKDILLYIPRRIYAHFRHIKELEEEKNPPGWPGDL